MHAWAVQATALVDDYNTQAPPPPYLRVLATESRHSSSVAALQADFFFVGRHASPQRFHSNGSSVLLAADWFRRVGASAGRGTAVGRATARR